MSPIFLGLLLLTLGGYLDKNWLIFIGAIILFSYAIVRL